MAFPTSPIDGQEYTTALGTTYKYSSADDKWYIIGTGDTDAIHDNEDGEIHAITEKSSPIGADEILIEDSAASYAKKRVQITNLPGMTELSEDATPQLGGPLDINNEEILVNGTLTSNQDYEGLVLDNITNATAFGTVVYISSANTVSACDKDTVNLAIGISVGTGKVLILGTIKNTSWNWASYIGKPIYIGDSGALTGDISGYTTGDMVQVIGIALDTYSILVKGIDWVKVA